MAIPPASDATGAKKFEYFACIDFGSTYTRVELFPYDEEDQEIITITFHDGTNHVDVQHPSIVGVKISTARMIYGRDAETAPESTTIKFYNIKTAICGGKHFREVHAQTKTKLERLRKIDHHYSLERLLEGFFEDLLTRTKACTNNQCLIRETVMALPPGIAPKIKGEMEGILRKVGWPKPNAQRTEPEMRFLLWLEKRRMNSDLDGKKIAVVDIGGGTANIAFYHVHRLASGKFECNEIIPADDTECGGEIVGVAFESWVKKNRPTLYDELVPEARTKMIDSFRERFKHFKGDGKDEAMEITAGNGTLSIEQASVDTLLKDAYSPILDFFVVKHLGTLKQADIAIKGGGTFYGHIINREFSDRLEKEIWNKFEPDSRSSSNNAVTRGLGLAVRGKLIEITRRKMRYTIGNGVNVLWRDLPNKDPELWGRMGTESTVLAVQPLMHKGADILTHEHGSKLYWLSQSINPKTKRVIIVYLFASKMNMEPEIYQHPDPEFSDFYFSPRGQYECLAQTKFTIPEHLLPTTKNMTIQYHHCLKFFFKDLVLNIQLLAHPSGERQSGEEGLVVIDEDDDVNEYLKEKPFEDADIQTPTTGILNLQAPEGAPPKTKNRDSRGLRTRSAVKGHATIERQDVQDSASSNRDVPHAVPETRTEAAEGMLDGDKNGAASPVRRRGHAKRAIEIPDGDGTGAIAPVKKRGRPVTRTRSTEKPRASAPTLSLGEQFRAKHQEAIESGQGVYVAMLRKRFTAQPTTDFAKYIEQLKAAAELNPPKGDRNKSLSICLWCLHSNEALSCSIPCERCEENGYYTVFADPDDTDPILGTVTYDERGKSAGRVENKRQALAEKSAAESGRLTNIDGAVTAESSTDKNTRTRSGWSGVLDSYFG